MDEVTKDSELSMDMELSRPPVSPVLWLHGPEYVRCSFLLAVQVVWPHDSYLHRIGQLTYLRWAEIVSFEQQHVG